mmetsp:Transcript_71569/g.205353  ORF Transcript_71569/g.205353 Transcript_71569/m.205353 type:complete len:299 (-) Transcript_71569:14-910(-)
MTVLSIVSMSGTCVADLPAQPGDTVLALKRSIYEKLPSAPPCWQRLLLGSRLLEDGDLVGNLDLPLEDDGSVVVSLILTMDPRDMLRDHSLAAEAASGLNSLGTAVPRYLAKLFETDEGDPVEPATAEETLYGVAMRLQDSHRKKLVLDDLRSALLPYAMRVLESSGLKEVRQARLAVIFSWLGAVAVARQIAWIGLLPRPLEEKWRWRVEQLRRHSDCPRVRVAAKAALCDPGGVSRARITELAALRKSLGRYMATSPAEEAQILKDFRERSVYELRKLETQTSDRHIQYAVSNALK